MVQILLAPIWAIIAIVVGWKLCHPKRIKVNGSPKNYNLNYETVSFKSNDNKTVLKGWMLKADNSRRTIIFSHGYLGNRTKAPIRSIELANYYVQKGYNVLMFDYRNMGESGGNMSTVGIMEAEDLIGAIDFVKKTQSNKIALIGWSTGGSSAIMAAGKRQVDAIITDSAFHDLESYLKENLTKWTKLPGLINPFIMFFFPLVSKGKHPKMSKPVDSLNNITCPIYFIHNDNDSKVPYSCSLIMHNMYKGVKQIWITKKGGHVMNHLSNEDYLENTRSFLDKVFEHRVSQI